MLFDDLRFHPDGTEKPEFILNREPYRNAVILVAGDNFGCGSSREHAPWALLDFGIRCILSTSFADIFYNNCFKNGILPVMVARDEFDALMADASDPENPVLTVDLEAQESTRPNGAVLSFAIDEFRRRCLLDGLDDIGLTMRKADRIDAFEARQREEQPWLYRCISEAGRCPRDGIGGGDRDELSRHQGYEIGPPGQSEIQQSLEPERLNAFQVFLHIRKCKEAGISFSLIRLGDAEASILGYPEITGMEDVAYSMSTLFDRPTWKWQMTNLFEAVRDLNRYRLRKAVLDLVYPNRKRYLITYQAHPARSSPWATPCEARCGDWMTREGREAPWWLPGSGFRMGVETAT